jgi:tetratricopeptide (TPR) repeat protein
MRESTVETAAELQRQGAQMRQRAQYTDAESRLLRALELEHDFAAAHLELGLTYRDQQRFEDAADYFQLAVHFAPDLAAGWLELGTALDRLGREESALAACRQATALDPVNGAAWIALGNRHKARQDWNAAVECYRTAVACDPRSEDAQSRLGYALYQAGNYAQSRACFDAALALCPDMVQAHHNLGLLLLETGHADEALASFRRALTVNPQVIETRACVAHALCDLGRFDESIGAYDEVLATDPNYSDAVINRSYALLMKGDFAGGWAAYEQRFRSGGQVDRNFPFRPWQGEPLAGKRLLIYAEQGLGDEIMFASCIPDVLPLAAHCVIECNSRLAALFRRSFPTAHVHGAAKNDDKKWLEALPRIDFQVSSVSLPYHLRRATSAFPARSGYLAAAASRVANWRMQLDSSAPLRVGIAWRGGTLRSRQFVRSIPLPQWAPLLRNQRVAFYALQYGDIAAELAALRGAAGATVKHLGKAIDDLDELAALIGALDLVISVDNTVAHLAGALGRPVWTLLPESPEWRYPRSGADMPWYPSMQLIRRMPGEDWESVIGRVAAALDDKLRLSCA